MGQCKCGYTRDTEKNCDGTHKVVKAVREQISKDIEAREPGPNTENEALFRIHQALFSSIAKGQK